MTIKDDDENNDDHHHPETKQKKIQIEIPAHTNMTCKKKNS